MKNLTPFSLAEISIATRVPTWTEMEVNRRCKSPCPQGQPNLFERHLARTYCYTIRFAQGTRLFRSATCCGSSQFQGLVLSNSFWQRRLPVCGSGLTGTEARSRCFFLRFLGGRRPMGNCSESSCASAGWSCEGPRGPQGPSGRCEAPCRIHAHKAIRF